MDIETFNKTLSQNEPPPGLSAALQALWRDARGDWNQAHDLSQTDTSPAGSWVHAYLHRKEGDTANAAYWYRRAGQSVASGPLDAERNAIVQALIAENYPAK